MTLSPTAVGTARLEHRDDVLLGDENSQSDLGPARAPQAFINAQRQRTADSPLAGVGKQPDSRALIRAGRHGSSL